MLTRRVLKKTAQIDQLLETISTDPKVGKEIREMRQAQAFSVCIRCGKTRIFLKRWKDRGENGKGTVVTHVETRCPDRQCQKIVDEKFQEMKDRRTQTEERKKAVILERSQAKKLKQAITP